jgi:integrase
VPAQPARLLASFAPEVGAVARRSRVPTSGPGCARTAWRTVPVPRFLAREITAAITGKNADALVFTMPGGSILRLSNWRRSAFLPARARAGLSARFRIHDLRYTAASLMIQAGYPLKMLQEIMGHVSITMTLDLYGHLYPGDMDRYADRLDSAADEAGKAKTRPDDDEDEQATE